MPLPVMIPKGSTLATPPPPPAPAASASSQIVSSSRSPRFSAPHTDHLFRLSVGLDELLLREAVVESSSSSISCKGSGDFRDSAAWTSASRASSSASGESGIVSSEDIDGDRERIEVGVDGEEDDEEYADET